MGCFCAVPEEFYCEVLLLDESKLTLTTQQQGIKVGAAGARCRVRDVGVRGFVSRLSPVQPGWPPCLRQRRGLWGSANLEML